VRADLDIQISHHITEKRHALNEILFHNIFIPELRFLKIISI